MPPSCPSQTPSRCHQRIPPNCPQPLQTRNQPPCSTSTPPTTPPAPGATSSSTSPPSSSAFLSPSAWSKPSNTSIIVISPAKPANNCASSASATKSRTSSTSTTPSGISEICNAILPSCAQSRPTLPSPTNPSSSGGTAMSTLRTPGGRFTNPEPSTISPKTCKLSPTATATRTTSCPGLRKATKPFCMPLRSFEARTMHLGCPSKAASQAPASPGPSRTVTKP